MAGRRSEIRVVIAGICGRMGAQTAVAVLEDRRLELTAGFERPGHPALGVKTSIETTDGSGRAAKVPVAEASAEALKDVAVLVDFSSAQAAPGLAELCASCRTAYVGGVTGLTGAQMQRIQAASDRVAVIYSPNMSAGVNLLSKLVAEAAEKIPPGYDVEIVETHHKAKLDVPSGTAAMLAKRAAKDKKIEISRREGVVKRESGVVTVHSLRGGDVVGEHEVRFIGMGETVTLSHKAHSRMAFARGVPPAVVFASGAAPGLYTMEDVLDEME